VKANSDLNDSTVVTVRRQWNHTHMQGQVLLEHLHDFHWRRTGGGSVGGFGNVAPRPFIYARMRCDSLLEGEIAHSCRHGPPPHEILVCITKMDNRNIYSALKELAGEPTRS
jgi:hypothetical protein